MIGGIDLGIIILYLVAVMVMGYFLGRNENADGFFVNHRKTGLFLLVLTTISTQVGAGTVLGLASSTYTKGISLGITYSIVILSGWLFMAWLAPRIKAWADQESAYTMGDYFKSRYGSRARLVASSVTLVSYFIITAVQFIAFARLVEATVGLPFVWALVISAVLTIIYTVFAGIKGDFYTDAVQFFVMLPVFIILFITVGNQMSFAEIFTNVPSGHFDLFNYAGPAFFIAAIVLGFPRMAVAMEVWQRVFAADSAQTARRSFIYSGLLNVVLIAASMVVGFMALKIVPGVEPDGAIYLLMKNLLPVGVLGVGFASMLAILMSSIDSMLMVGSATLTKDFYLVRYPEADEKQTLYMGRLYILLFGLASLIIALLFQDIVRLSVAAAQVLIVFAPALLGGFLWRRANEQAAFWSMLIGFIGTLGFLIPMPDTAFIPGLVLSLVIFVGISLRSPRVV